MEIESIKKNYSLVKSLVITLSGIKNSIKNQILKELNVVESFLSSGFSTVNPEKIRKSLDSIRSLSIPWIKSKDVISRIEELIDSVTFIIDDGEGDKDEEKETDIVIEKDQDYFYKKVLKVSKRPIPKKLEKLDIVYLPVGIIPHYCLVYKVLGDICYVLVITTDVKKFHGYEIKKSRLFSGVVVFSLYQFPTSTALSSFVMPYDSKSEGNEIIRECTEFLNKTVLIKLKKGKLCKSKKLK